MNRPKKPLKKRIGKWKISSQLVLVYFVAVFLPIVLIGSFLLATVGRMQRSYYSDLLQANNDGVSQTLYEITSQIYTISESIVYNDELIDFLNGEYATEQEMLQAAADTTLLDKYAAKYVGVEEIRVYIDREDMVNYGQFHRVTADVRQSAWYRKAQEQYMPFWLAFQSETVRGQNLVWNLTLVRKMILVGGTREAVIMIKVRDSYLSSRLTNSKYTTMFAIDNQPVAFSDRLSLYGSRPPIEIDREADRFTFLGNAELEGEASLVSISTLPLSRTENKLYLVSYDTSALANIDKLLDTCMMIFVGALILPLVVMILYARWFTGQVVHLRDEMHKANRGEYSDMAGEFMGSEELSDAFNDLREMVRNIQRMEAEQYEAHIRAQNIRNDQQKMEFKMLASQINPHFLYNTLETIRMKALAAGDTEVANATKLLGKSMRYVLENTGMRDTTLQKELDHIVIYLQIQQLRFGDRVNYEMHIQPELDPAEYRMLPLLLQPVVENAIVHGLESREADGRIWIAVYIMDGILYIDISDNGGGMTREELDALHERFEHDEGDLPTNSIGLYNINRRIKLNYGDAYGIQILSTKGEGTRVSVMIPPLKTGDDAA